MFLLNVYFNSETIFTLIDFYGKVLACYFKNGVVISSVNYVLKCKENVNF